MQYIFNIVCFLKQKELQITFVILFINYPLKMNPIINPLARNGDITNSVGITHLQNM